MGTVVVHHRHYKVNLSAGRLPFRAALKSGMKETFFPDDPFRGLNHLPVGKRAWNVLKYFVPAFDWVPNYSLDSFCYDLLAGLTIASLSIPQGISYATLASLPPIIGLYSCFVPPLVYAVFGSSKNLGVGPVATSSLLVASIVGSQVKSSDNLQLYTHLFYTAAFFTGILQMALGLLRLGMLVDFLSRPAITGFMGGTAIVIMLQQLKGMVGMKHFTTKTDIVSVLRYVFENKNQWQWQSAVLGVCFLIFLVLTEQVRKRRPKLFWVSAMSPLMVVIAGCVFSFLVRGQKHGIPIVGSLKRGINPSSVSQLTFQSQYLGVAVKAGFVSGMLALAEGVAVGRSFAVMKNERIDGNKEMIAFGLMNLAGSLTSCYITTGAFSKTAVNYHAGCKTAMSNVVMSICMMLVLLLLAPLFKYTPLVALSAIIMSAMFGLIKHKEIRGLFDVDKFDFIVCMSALLGVIFSTMIIGLAISVGLSIIRALLYVARPTTSKLGNMYGTDTFCDVRQYPDALVHPNILILQVGSPIYFANAEYLRERIARWVEDEEKIASNNNEDLMYVILDIGGVTSIDNPGIGMLREVHKYLERKGIKMALTSPRLEVVGKLVLSGFVELIGEDWMFLSNSDAIATCRYALQGSKHGEPQV